MGRDDRFRAQQAARRQQADAGRLDEQRRAAAVTSAKIYDRFGRLLLPGATIEFHSSLPLVFMIRDIKPVLDPNAPPGTFMMELESSVMLPMQNGVAADRMTLVMMPQMGEAAATDENTEQPPAEDPPPPTDADAPADDPAAPSRYHKTFTDEDPSAASQPQQQEGSVDGAEPESVA